MARKVVKRGPHKKRRRKRPQVVEYVQHCDKCERCAQTCPNWATALRAFPVLWDRTLACVNQYGGIHLAAA